MSSTRPSRPGFTWDRESIAAAAFTWAEQHDGKPPTDRDWARATAAHPAGRTVERVFGPDAPWTNLRIAAGLGATTPRTEVVSSMLERRQQPGRRPATPDELIRQCQLVLTAEQLDRRRLIELAGVALDVAATLRAA